MSETFTSDGSPRPNFMRAIMAVPDLSWNLDWSARVLALFELGSAINANGGSISVVDKAGTYDHSNMCQRVNDISRALNGMGATPALPVYDTIDINSFNSVVKNIMNSMTVLSQGA